MMMGSEKISVAALYRFAPLPAFAHYRMGLKASAQSAGVKGTLLLAPEGINGTIAGPADGISAVLSCIRALPGLSELEVKFSTARTMPFSRLKVRLKREIVTMGVEDIDPLKSVGTYVAPEDWNALIGDPETLVIDTRNAYEIEVGTFARALDPGTRSFREFPAWMKAQLASADQPPKRIAMFCTGGIRCEKATAYVKQLGFGDVFHLEGGILRYLETVPESESLWRGACYVFDERVAVGHGLTQAPFKLCKSCGKPVAASDNNGGGFAEDGCAACRGDGDDRNG